VVVQRLQLHLKLGEAKQEAKLTGHGLRSVPFISHNQ
jgi:hypothetical protein